MGMFRDMVSGVSFCAPSFASVLLSSFPRKPAWPLIHLKIVGAILVFSRYAALLKRSVLLMPIHPLFSQLGRCSVRPSITYLESVTILSLRKFGVTSAVAMTAMSSPTWFDWCGPGTFIALFSLCSLPNHIPLLHFASTFPFFIHAPSVNTVILFVSRFIPLVRFLMAEVSVIFAKSVKMWKHSASESLQVIIGSKIMSLLV